MPAVSRADTALMSMLVFLKVSSYPPTSGKV